MMSKRTFGNTGQQKKKAKQDNLNVYEKEQLRSTRKKKKKLCLITLKMKKKNI